MSQFGIELDVFVESQTSEIEELKCCICMNVLLDPVYGTHCNSHQFCRACIREWIRTRAANCPLCRTPMRFTDVGTDHSANRKVMKLVAKCSNGVVDGVKCDWRGPYGNLAHHERRCSFKKVTCEHCEMILERHQHLPHLGVCPKMEQPCEDCLLWVQRDNMRHHVVYVCIMKEMPCPLQCQEVILRKDFLHHVVHDCTNRVTVCPIPGCGMLVQDVHRHNREDGEYHTFLLMQSGTHQRHFNGPIHSFKYVVEDITRMVKSSPFCTGQHEFRVMLLPPDRDARDNIGLYIQLCSGHPTLVNVRMKVTYGTVTRSLEGKLNLKAGEVKGWSAALKAEVLDQEQISANLELNIVIQHYFS
ncbi:PREDICTED: TNF receptor-associated factor 6-like [Branchiostoma belcheri]|uniref:TNF receptor-associated factor 6-like n=1 Tax=Branchiostoma belcheri TaxID=7741 RepID=A0A6P4YAC1_BRABE|nr:PREDICTED: TNF receptor-associated factor 6-like [Branchiostoma belcheri]KAI8478484.1 hypothetical protein Bbelb_437880 [Branchiostoma belcheri]